MLASTLRVTAYVPALAMTTVSLVVGTWFGFQLAATLQLPLLVFVQVITAAREVRAIESVAIKSAVFIIGLHCTWQSNVPTWQPHSSFVIAGMLHNAAGARFDAQFDGAIEQSGDGLIVNEGTFQKSAGTLSTICSVPFINNGVTRVSSGTLQFDGGYTNLVGTISIAGGTFRTLQPLWLPGGLMTGWGTVRANVANAACIRPSSSNGILRINGDYEQLLGGRVEFEIGGNVPGTNQSRLNITGSARLRGTVGVIWNEGYAPAPGTSFPVLTFTSHVGEYCCFDNCIRLGQNCRLTPAYTATSLTLTAIAAPDPTNVPLRVAVDGGALVSWPVEFPGFDLYWSTNLNFTNWTLIPGVINRHLEAPPLPPEKYFQLRKRADDLPALGR